MAKKEAGWEGGKRSLERTVYNLHALERKGENRGGAFVTPVARELGLRGEKKTFGKRRTDWEEGGEDQSRASYAKLIRKLGFGKGGGDQGRGG